MTKHQLLAWDLVEGLGDEKHKGIYFRIAKNYKEFFLRQILGLVKEAHQSGKIKADDRGKYFMGILKKELIKYGKSVKNHTRKRSGSKKKGGSRRRPEKS